MSLLFSYGTLQKAEIQLATFGRLLTGRADELPQYELAAVIASVGATHANASLNGRSDSRVSGMAFEVTEAELLASDRYEAIADYKRIAVVLATGASAWVYVHAPNIACANV
jgi:gamma-glutamylcyclotransferase (GGCT)/AIG2-like uncharacterized protein YtfP